MRLINVDTFQLEEFFDDDIPPYAILSHTWGAPKEELSYEDINSRPIPPKAGYQKLKYLCTQTASDGLSWAWCDTYCINKNSSSELSEAINSMFRWYENANVCYAYLSDVPFAESKELWVQRFRDSRWFTRGWTLQELLAPNVVKFYTHSWHFLGTKGDLSNLLKEITGINYTALTRPWIIPSYGIANKMAWASQRVTSRLEDRAYCMLGILGIHIPLLYGEGRNAFRRVQEELIRISDDESVFAHSGPNILAEGPEAFSLGYKVTSLPATTLWNNPGIPPEEITTLQCHPFAVTNKGINIRLRLFFQKASSECPTSQLLGILNCRHRIDFKLCLAIPLRATTMPNTYIRAPGDVQLVADDETLDAAHCSIFIQQEERHTNLTCFLKSNLMEQYNVTAFSETTTFTYTLGYHRVILYFNPKKPQESHGLSYIFQEKSDAHLFVVRLVFDMVEHRSRVLLLPRSGSIPNSDFDVELENQRWQDSAELEVLNTLGPPDDQHTNLTPISRVRAKLTQEISSNRNFWSLTVLRDG